MSIIKGIVVSLAAVRHSDGKYPTEPRMLGVFFFFFSLGKKLNQGLGHRQEMVLKESEIESNSLFIIRNYAFRSKCS